MNLTLIRHAYLPSATLGYLYAAHLKLATLEEPWTPDPDGPGGQRRQPGKSESCIPDGGYTLRPHVSARYPDGVWALVNPQLGVYYQPGDIPEGQLWGRSAILIHAANRTADILGCLAVGMRYQILDNEHVVLESRTAIEQLRGLLGRDTHSLQIRPIAGTSEGA
jgi:hypothetical protein